MAALKAGYDYAEANLPKQDPFVIEPMDKTTGMILIEGNAAAAIGCMMAGVTFVGWYPITPSSSSVRVADRLPEEVPARIRRPARATYAVIQAEDELAALGMVIGAGWMGARAMTSTAGPGISLMAEFTGLGYYAEMPAVIFDVQRVRPVHRSADAHRAAGHPLNRRPVARRHEAPDAAPGLGRPSATRWPWTPSTSPSGCRRRSS